MIIGLDIGQAQDPSALTVLDPSTIDEGTRYDLRHIDRMELGTSYPEVARRVAAVARHESTGSSPDVVVDATGVGRPVVDMLKEEGLYPWCIWITGGDSVNQDGREFRVPKRELASTVQALLQSGRLRFADGLPLAGVLKEELQNFKAKISLDTGHASFEHWRESDTDDIVLSLACALWYGERGRQSWLMS